MDGDISLRSLVILSKKQKQNRKLKIVGPIISSTSPAVFSSSSSPFKLPDGWGIEQRRRVTGRFDKYYYEPGTGRKFRSLLSIQKYLSGENVGRNRSEPKHEKNMQIVPHVFKSGSHFNLPNGWVVEEKQRGNISYTDVIDRYYYEPGTGQKFRSLLSVQKYLSGENVARNRSKPKHEKNMQIVPCVFKSGSHFNLPNGWVVEERRRSNINYTGVIDRCYIEPGTGKRFRSLISVERYLTEGKEYAAPKASSPENQLYLTDGKEYTALSLGDNTRLKCSRNKIYDLQQPLKCLRKHVPRNEVETSILDLCSPPAKAKWVLSPWGNIWSPFIDDIQVPKSVKHKWSDTLIWTLNDRC